MGSINHKDFRDIPSDSAGSVFKDIVNASRGAFCNIYDQYPGFVLGPRWASSAVWGLRKRIADGFCGDPENPNGPMPPPPLPTPFPGGQCVGKQYTVRVFYRYKRLNEPESVGFNAALATALGPIVGLAVECVPNQCPNITARTRVTHNGGASVGFITGPGGTASNYLEYCEIYDVEYIRKDGTSEADDLLCGDASPDYPVPFPIPGGDVIGVDIDITVDTGDDITIPIIVNNFDMNNRIDITINTDSFIKVGAVNIETNIDGGDDITEIVNDIDTNIQSIEQTVNNTNTTVNNNAGSLVSINSDLTNNLILTNDIDNKIDTTLNNDINFDAKLDLTLDALVQVNAGLGIIVPIINFPKINLINFDLTVCEEKENADEDIPELTKIVILTVTKWNLPNNKRQWGGGTAPDVHFSGWFEFRAVGFSFPRQPIHFLESCFTVPPGAEGFAYTLYYGSRGIASFYTLKQEDP